MTTGIIGPNGDIVCGKIIGDDDLEIQAGGQNRIRITADGYIDFCDSRIIGLAAGIIAIDDIATLSVFDDLLLPDGAVAEMRSVRDKWTLDKNSSAAPDGITVIITNSAVGRWIRACQCNRYWSIQDTWYVAYTSGDDEASGTDIDHPIKTLEEWQRRIGPYLDHIGVVTVNIIEDLHQESPMILPTVRQDEAGPLIFQGVIGPSNCLYTGSVSSYTAMDPTTNQESLLTDNAVAGWGAHGLIGKLLIMTSGAASGYVAWPLSAEESGNNTTRVNRFTDPTSFSYANPAPADTFKVYQPIKITGAGFVNLGAGVEIWIKYLAIETDNTTIAEDWNGESQYLCCSVKTGKVFTFGGAQWWLICLFDNPAFVANGGGELLLWSCSAINARFRSGYGFGIGKLTVYDYLIAYGDGTPEQLFTIESSSFLDCQAAVGCWNYGSTIPVQLNTQGRANFWYGGRLFGDTDAAYCISMEPGCCIVYDSSTLSNMTGASDHSVNIAGTEKNWNELPYVEMSKMAGIISL